MKRGTYQKHPEWHIGQVVGGATILAHAPTFTTNLAYRLKCACGDEFTRERRRVLRIIDEGRPVICSECLIQWRRDNWRNGSAKRPATTAEPEAATVTDWNYKVKPINPNLAKKKGYLNV